METKLEAGPALNALIPPKLGYQWVIRTGGLGDEVGRWVDPATGEDAYPSDLWPQPEYSTDWNAAAGLIELAKKKGINFTLNVYTEPEEYSAYFHVVYDKFTRYAYGDKADTGPLAMVRAFLAIPNEVIQMEIVCD